MKITRIDKLEDCFDGTSVYAFHFDRPWTRAAIRRIAWLGKLEYFADFPRPFYRLHGAGGLQMKGVEGMLHCRVVVPRNRQVQFGEELESILASAATTDVEPSGTASPHPHDSA